MYPQTLLKMTEIIELTEQERQIVRKLRTCKEAVVLMVLDTTPPERPPIRITGYGKEKKVNLSKALEIVVDAEKRIKNLIE